MTTVFVAERPPAIQSWLDRRIALGQDRHDEVWEGVYHVAPGPSFAHAAVDSELGAVLRTRARARGLWLVTAFNLGQPEDFRVPDGGVHRDRVDAVYTASAAMVIEVRSPGDETYAKFDFYAAHGVEEVLVADPTTRTIRIWVLIDGGYTETGRSTLLEVTAAELVAEIDWP